MTMRRPRNLDERVQVNLRLKEIDRLRLVAAAQQAGATINGFIRRLLMNAIEQDCSMPPKLSHAPVAPRVVKAIEYFENGMVKHVEFVPGKPEDAE
jgi:hypothetical protein